MSISNDPMRNQDWATRKTTAPAKLIRSLIHGTHKEQNYMLYSVYQYVTDPEKRKRMIGGKILTALSVGMSIIKLVSPNFILTQDQTGR